MSYQAVALAYAVPLSVLPSPTKRLVLVTLCERADKDGKAWPGLNDFRRRTGLSASAIWDSIATLRDELQFIQSKPPSVTGKRSNIYTINLERLAAAAQHGSDEVSEDEEAIPSPNAKQPQRVKIVTRRSPSATRTGASATRTGASATRTPDRPRAGYEPVSEQVIGTDQEKRSPLSASRGQEEMTSKKMDLPDPVPYRPNTAPGLAQLFGLRNGWLPTAGTGANPPGFDALRNQIKRWMTTGSTPASPGEVRAMIDLFYLQDRSRQHNSDAWKFFVSQREPLLEHVRNRNASRGSAPRRRYQIGSAPTP